MSYTIINKSDSFLVLNIGGKSVAIPHGKRLELIHDRHITPEIRFKARKGIIALIHESDRSEEAKVVRASEIADRRSLKRKIITETKDEEEIEE